MKRLFIANRGEIACRIAATAARLGILTSGAYTPQDAKSKFVRMLDELAQLPSGDLSANYLNQELLIETAKRFQADAVHPGYGFLAENPDFAEKVIGAGLKWIGPNPKAMRELGGKIRAKEIARDANVPVAPWRKLQDDPADQDIDRVIAETGLPLLIKAAHGGGGRGQRVVRVASEFKEALRAARSESQRSFGSAEVFVERYLEKPRHIEVQILADHHGNVVTFGERDCTLQRRNQKVVEEAPAAILNEEARQAILQAACSLVRTAGYTNAGTVEFLAEQNDGGEWQFYFMEVNARLQVEHPVTEAIFGIDLVQLQLQVAEGASLKDANFASHPSGHAIEVRLCAENPDNQFLPTPGPITYWNIPCGNDLRLDTGFEEGDVIAQEYDSLFAKLIGWGETREQAIERVANALDEALIAGTITNKFFLSELLKHPDFRSNNTFTRWIEQHPEVRDFPVEALDEDLVQWARTFHSQLLVQRRIHQSGLDSLRWRPRRVALIDFRPDPEIHGTSQAGLTRIAGEFILRDGEPVFASGWITRFELFVTFQRAVYGVGQRRVWFAGLFEIEDLRTHHGPIVAQVPGVVLEVRARAEQTIEAQQPILIVEAMKMEMPLSLPIAAKIKSIDVKQGDRIQPGQTLVHWEPV